MGWLAGGHLGGTGANEPAKKKSHAHKQPPEGPARAGNSIHSRPGRNKPDTLWGGELEGIKEQAAHGARPLSQVSPGMCPSPAAGIPRACVCSSWLGGLRGTPRPAPPGARLRRCVGGGCLKFARHSLAWARQQGSREAGQDPSPPFFSPSRLCHPLRGPHTPSRWMETLCSAAGSDRDSDRAPCRRPAQSCGGDAGAAPATFSPRWGEPGGSTPTALSSPHTLPHPTPDRTKPACKQGSRCDHKRGGGARVLKCTRAPEPARLP